MHKRACNVCIFRLGLHFACHHWWLGGDPWRPPSFLSSFYWQKLGQKREEWIPQGERRRGGGETPGNFSLTCCAWFSTQLGASPKNCIFFHLFQVGLLINIQQFFFSSLPPFLSLSLFPPETLKVTSFCAINNPFSSPPSPLLPPPPEGTYVLPGRNEVSKASLPPPPSPSPPPWGSKRQFSIIQAQRCHADRERERERESCWRGKVWKLAYM